MLTKEILAGILAIIIALGLAYMAIDISNEQQKKTEIIYECLTPIAEEFCENNYMVFLDGKVYSNRFYCFETERSMKGEQFLFSKEEQVNCKKFAYEVASVE